MISLIEQKAKDIRANGKRNSANEFRKSDPANRGADLAMERFSFLHVLENEAQLFYDVDGKTANAPKLEQQHQHIALRKMGCIRYRQNEFQKIKRKTI